jgi:hypothetical protein
MTELRPNQWLGMLVKLAAPMDSVKAATAALEMEVALSLIPAHKLTDESALYVGSHVKKFPALGIICGLIEEWWQEYGPKPALRALPPPDEAPHAAREREEKQNRLTWEAPERVLASLRSVREMGENHRMYEPCGRLLGRAVWKYAPHNLHLIPPEWHPSE